MDYSFHPSSRKSTAAALMLAIIISAILFYLRDYLGDLLMQILVGIWAIAVVYASLKFALSRLHTVTLGEDGITYKSGILVFKKVVFGYRQVTESSFSQTIIDRIFGQGTLNVDTPGGTSMALHLDNIKMDDIKRTLDAIEGKSRK